LTLPLGMTLKRYYVIFVCLIILLSATASELIILRSVLIRHQKLDAQSALSFLETRISGYYETLQILSKVSNIPPYLNKLSWLLDELQGQPFLAGVLITEGHKVLLDSFPKNQIPPAKAFDFCSKGQEINGILYMCKNIEPVQGRSLFLLVGLETKFTRILWHEGLFYGCIVFFCSGLILFLYAIYINHLVNKQEELEKKLRASEGLATMGKLAAMLTHEVRNPLNALTMGLHYMSEVGEVKPEIIERLKREVGRLSGLTTELLSLSRGFDIKPESIEVNELVMELKFKFLDSLREKNANLEILAPESIRIIADKRWLTRALENLVRNSLDELYEGGSIRVRVNRVSSGVEFRVEDTGPGIAHDIAPHLFDPFFTTKNGGMGLGLYIVQKVVEAHGGKVRLDSSGGNGAIFVIYLPSGRNIH